MFGIGTGIAPFVEKFAQGGVNFILADVILQGVHDHRSFVVVNVRLPLGQRHWLLFLTFRRPAAQVVVHFVFQEFLHDFGREAVLHHHQGRVLRLAFGQHGVALHPRLRYLVAPPLVRHLVGGYVEGHIQVFVRVADFLNKADALREGNGIGERLGEAGVAREFHDTHLPILVRAEIPGIITERLLHRRHHLVEVVFMAFVVIYFQLHGLTVGILPQVALHFVAGRDDGVKINHRHVHFVIEVSPSVLSPFLLEVAGRDGDLIRFGADNHLETDVVGIVAEETLVQAARVVLRHHALLFG